MANSKSLEYTIVDAFTATAFKGNPASVIILENDHTLNEKDMQIIAREFNLSETTFVVAKPELDAPDKSTLAFGLRWFTPKVEVPLCGHATLAASHVLFSSPAIVPRNVGTVSFETLSGTLVARRFVEIDRNEKIELEFPAGVPRKPIDGGALEDKVKDVVARATLNKAKVLFAGVGDADSVSFKQSLLIELDNTFNLEKEFVDPAPFVSTVNHYTQFFFLVG